MEEEAAIEWIRRSSRQKTRRHIFIPIRDWLQCALTSAICCVIYCFLCPLYCFLGVLKMEVVKEGEKERVVEGNNATHLHYDKIDYVVHCNIRHILFSLSINCAFER